MDPIALRQITNSALERRLFTWFINQYVEYYDFLYNMISKARDGQDTIILFLYSCEDIVIFREDGSWEIFGCYSEEEELRGTGDIVYKMRELVENPIFREVLTEKFPSPFVITYKETGVDVSW
jgi:hypothetical protein